MKKKPTKKPPKRPTKKTHAHEPTKTDTHNEENQALNVFPIEEKRKERSGNAVRITTMPPKNEIDGKPATPPESGPDGEMVKSPLLGIQNERQMMAKQLFGRGSPYRKWLVGMVATHGRSPLWAAQQFITAFGTSGKTPEQLKNAIAYNMYQSKRFQDEMDKARQRMRMDLNMLVAQAPFILAPQRLASLSDLAESAINKGDSGLALRLFKAIRDELEFAGAKEQSKGGDKASVLSISFKDGQTHVEVTLGDILGTDDVENDMKDFNPARADSKVRGYLEAARRSAMAGADPTAGIIDVDTTGEDNEADDDDETPVLI